MPKEKQAERNRVAVRAYYERNQESIREKRRIGMAQKKAEKQLRRRRWDPPKKPVPDPAPTVQLDGGKNLDPASEPDAAPGTIASRYSRTSAEIAATGVLLSLNRPEIGSLPNTLDDRALSQRIAPPNVQSGAGNNADDTGFGRKEARLDSNLFKGSQRPQPPLLPAAKPERMTDFATELEGRKYLKLGRLPPGTAALSLMQEISLERTGCVGLLSRVQAGQVRVSEINSAPLTPPTTDDTLSWTPERKRVWDRFGPNVGMLDEGGRLATMTLQSIHIWLLAIDSAHRKLGGFEEAVSMIN
ncbi:hypothetical protein C8J57DRAFT_1231914 [Mycena rebaudengoi]|nr:hypothetical protein C8J57DRAFT_1231914 [Mycena rebaudengoi]